MAKIPGSEEGGSKNEPHKGRLTRKPDQWAVLTEVVLNLLSITEGLLQQGPSSARVDLRDLRFRLCEAFPRLKPTDSDLAQWVAEEDNEPHGY